MKTRLVIFGLIALSCIASSCKRDKVPGKNGDVIYVRVNDRALTRSADTLETAPARELLFSVPAVLDNGDSVLVKAYLSDMDETMPETRGAALTTATIGEKLGSFPTTLYKDGSVYIDEWANIPVANVPVRYESATWEFGAEGDVYHWPGDGSSVTFCSYAPAGATGLTNINWNGGERLTFNYAMEPAAPVDGWYSDAANQPDLVFAMDPQSKDSRSTGGKHYADIQFSHALTAVRFVRGNMDNCTVESIALNGFYGAGTATATLTQGATTHDNKLNFTWTTSGEPKNFVQTFRNTLTDSDAHQDTESQAVNGASLDPTADQSYTFMMIPQLLADGATIEIKIGERLHPLSLLLTGSDMDAKLKDWRTYAGKVITVSVSSVQGGGLVDIEIGENLSGNVKSNVVITNTPTGNDAYVRVAIIANWVNAEKNVVYPYAVENLAGDSHCEGFRSDKWVYRDGFYYCKEVLHSNGETAPLFTKFTAPVLGEDGYPAHVPNIDHLQMTILVQGVDEAKVKDGTMKNEFGWPTEVFVINP